MAVSTAALRELHRIHSQLSDLRDRLDRGPRQIQAREANVAQQQAVLDAALDNVKKTKMATDQKQLELKAGEQKIEDLRVKLNGCSSNKEYQALLEQIAASEMAGSVLADEILESFDKIEQLEKKVTETEALLEVTNGELAKCREIVTQQSRVIQADIQRLEADLAEAEKGLPSDIKADYQRVIRGKGAEGMAEVENCVCLGCGVSITLNMQNQLLLSKPVFCKSCGCLLYISES